MEITKSSTNNTSNLSPFFKLINNLSLTSICQLDTIPSKKTEDNTINIQAKRKLDDLSPQNEDKIQKKIQSVSVSGQSKIILETDANSDTLPSEDNSTKSPSAHTNNHNFSLATPNKLTDPSESSSLSKSKISIINDFLLPPYNLIHDKLLNTPINGGNIIKPKPLRPLQRSEYADESTKSNSKQSPISESDSSMKKKEVSRNYEYKLPRAAFLDFEFSFPENNFASRNDDSNSGVRKSSRRKPRDSAAIETKEPSMDAQKTCTFEFIKNLEIILKKKDINEKKAKDMLKKNNWAVSRALLTVKKNIPFYVNYFMK